MDLDFEIVVKRKTRSLTKKFSSRPRHSRRSIWPKNRSL